MGESLSDYPPTTKYTWPLKVTIFIHFRESSFYSKASFLFGVSMLFNVLSLGVHLNIESQNQAKGTPWDNIWVSLTTYTKKQPSMAWKCWITLKGCYVTHTPILSPFLKKDLPISYEVYQHISSLRWSN